MSVLRGTVWNLAGLLTPLLVALVTIPPTIAGLGLERLGALTLAWMVLGYLSVFDLGVGRALTQRVAVAEAAGRLDELPALVGTALGLTVALGAAGALALGLPAGWIVARVLRVPPPLLEEARGVLRLLALVLPFALATAALRGVLEGRRRFDLVNVVRLPLGAFTFAAPLLVLPFSRRLDAVVAVLTAGRVVALVAHLVLCRRAVPALGAVSVSIPLAAPLMVLGGWMTVSNVVGPLMVYLDRFAVGALLGLPAVAYYATPFELVTKLLLVPMALGQVLFPAFAGRLLDDPAGAARLQERSFGGLLLVLLPPVLVIVVWAPQILGTWLGPDFAQHGTTVLRWLALGVLLNGIAHVPFALLQGAGRMKTTAVLHLVELPFYLAGLLWLLRSHGVAGAAIAWTARAGVDMLALAVLARRQVRTASGQP